MQGLSEGLLESKGLSFAAAAIAFLVAALLILLIFRIVFGRRLRLPRNGRVRQPRLGIVDAFDLDRQRQLVIVRRDNVEHLLMIGGPNDLVIESEIVRADSRDGRVREKDLRDKELREAPMSAGAPWPAPVEVPVSRSVPRTKPYLEPDPGFAASYPEEAALPPPAAVNTPRPPVFPTPARRTQAAPVVNSPGPRMPSREPLRTEPAQPGAQAVKGISRTSLATPFLRSSVQRPVPGAEVKAARPSPADSAPLVLPGLNAGDLEETAAKAQPEPQQELSAVPPMEAPAPARSPAGPVEAAAPEGSATPPMQSQLDTLEEEMAKLLGRG